MGEKIFHSWAHLCFLGTLTDIRCRVVCIQQEFEICGTNPFGYGVILKSSATAENEGGVTRKFGYVNGEQSGNAEKNIANDAKGRDLKKRFDTVRRWSKGSFSNAQAAGMVPLFRMMTWRW
jgi:hypothetical protein